MVMEKEAMTEVDSRAENPYKYPPPPPHLRCESQNQSQTQEEEEEEEENKGIAMMIMLGKKRHFSSPSEADGGEFVTPSDSSTVTNTSSKQEVVLHPCHRHRPPRSLLSSSPTSDLLVGEGHRLEEIVRVLKRMHSSLRLRREYWSSPPTSAELRLHHLILIHVNSYISLFDIEQSDDGRALDLDLDLEELYDALESKALPVSFANFLCEARKAACPRREDDPLLRNTSAPLTRRL